MSFFLNLTIAITSLLYSAKALAQNDFQITIERKYSSEHCTMGYLVEDNQVIAYTLELPWRDNKNNISCIPKGTYSGTLRYDKNDKWRIELKDVPDRTNVQIHIGNYTSDIKGCVLVGTGAKIENCSVQNSAKAYTNLKNLFYGTAAPNSTPNRNITVIFK